MKVDVACPACEGRRVEWFKQWKLPGKQARPYGCADCGLLFVHPQPTQESLDEYYAPGGGWQASRTEKSPKTPQTRTKGAAPAMFAALDRYFPTSTPVQGSTVFDFGCGPGTWLNSFQDHGWETWGLEPSSDDAFVRHHRLDAVPPEPRFDLVLAYHVLEHLPRPLETMRELARCLRPGGHFFVSVPRIDTLDAHKQVDYCIHPRHHIVGFTEVCLRGLLARAGFEVLATFHELDDRFSRGVPVRMRMLARKSAGTTAVPGAEPIAALRPVVDAYVALREAARALKNVAS
jgi:SAM-dependent methyltransferase